MGRTGYPLVENSPWPILASFCGLSVTGSFIMLFHEGLIFPSCLSLAVAGLVCSIWWGDVIYEGVYLGRHTSLVLRNFYIGMKLFILSEVFFFVSFFWALVHVKVGELSFNFEWPPKGIGRVNPWGLPLLNTALLLSSAGVVTLADKYVKAFNKCYLFSDDYNSCQTNGLISFFLTILLGVIFMGVQAFEYYVCSFCFSDSAFGSCFFIMTGFHGMHVFVGIVFLSVASVRLYLGHFSKSMNMFNVEAAIWYWHFVDVVWLLLFALLYVGAD